MFGGMMDGFGYGFGWIGMILNLVITIGLIVGIILFIIWVVRRINPSPSPGFPEDQSSSQEVLKIRYARGEISREEYKQIMLDLNE